MNNSYYQSPYQSDCERIADVALRHRYLLTVEQAEDLWNDFSETFAAGWLSLPEDDEELWRDIESRVVGKHVFIKRQ